MNDSAASSPSVRPIHDVLVVDGDVDSALRDSGLAVRSAGTVAEARAALSLRTPTVLVANMVLPDGDAWDLVVELRKSGTRHAVGVIAIGNADHRSDANQWFDAVVRAPVDAAHLRDLVDQLAAVMRASSARSGSSED